MDGTSIPVISPATILARREVRTEAGVSTNFYRRLSARPSHRRETLEVLLHQPAQALVVFLLHVHEFHATAVGPDVAHHRREVNFPQPAANFELNRIAHIQAARGF